MDIIIYIYAFFSEINLLQGDTVPLKKIKKSKTNIEGSDK